MPLITFAYNEQGKLYLSKSDCKSGPDDYTLTVRHHHAHFLPYVLNTPEAKCQYVQELLECATALQFVSASLNQSHNVAMKETASAAANADTILAQTISNMPFPKP